MGSIAPAAVHLPSRLSAHDAFVMAVAECGRRVTEQSAVWLGRLLPKLGRFLEVGRSIEDIRLAQTADVEAWVNAALPDGRLPSLATRHNRRSAATAGFLILRELGLVDVDPARDVVLPDRRRGRTTRPLTDGEIGAGRAASVASLAETRLPSVWALAEATATTHEIPLVLPVHVDLVAGTVFLSGSSKTSPREATLTA